MKSKFSSSQISQVASIAVAATLILLLAGCGTTTSTSKSQFSVSFPSSGQQYALPASMNAGATASIAAILNDAPQNVQVNWTVSCTVSACGSFSPTSTASSSPTTYTAPTKVPTGGMNVTITATSQSGSNTTQISAQVKINAITVAFTQNMAPPVAVLPSGTASMAATVNFDALNGGVTWSVTCGSAQCGSFSQTSTASGVATTYTAPSSAPTGGSVTITATSVTDNTKSASASVIIGVPPISVTFTQGEAPPSSLGIYGTASIAATVANDPANAGVTWSVTCGSAQCGSFNPTSTASAGATVYTAPSAIPTGGSVTITATSVSDHTKFVSASVSINDSIVVTLSTPPPSSMNTSATAPVAATVFNDPTHSGVTWSVSCSGAPCGTILPATTASGVATTYTAPANGTGAGFTLAFASGYGLPTSMNTSTVTDLAVSVSKTITITATAAADSTKSASASVAVNDPSGVSWSVTCGSVGQCGSFNPTTTGNIVPTTYTAPSSVPSGNSGKVTITATSVNDSSSTLTGNITITNPATTLADGTYVFQLSGEDNVYGSGIFDPFAVVGAFTIQSGAITGGEQDYTDYNYGLLLDGIQSTPNSTITSTGDGNLQIILNTGDTSIGINGVETLNVALTNSSSGAATWFDSWAAGNGTISLQSPSSITALPSSGYAFVAGGYNGGVTPAAIGGILNVDNLSGTGTISGTGSVYDLNDSNNPAPLTNQTLNPSSVTGAGTNNTPDAYGQVTFNLCTSASPCSQNQPTPYFGFVGYIVDATHIALVEGADLYQGYMSGVALAQGANTGTFNSGSLSATYVVGAQGGEPTGQLLNFAGALAFSSGSVTGTADFNDTIVPSSGSITGGSYTVDASGTGRATISGLTGTDLNYNTSTSSPDPATLQLYLDGNGNALVASMDLYDVTYGPAYQQASGALAGSYALSAAGNSASTFNNWSAVGGPVNIVSGSITGFTDFNYFNETIPSNLCGTAGPVCAHITLSGTLSGNTGTITGLGADSLVTGTATSDTFDFYVIDSNRAFGIETDTTQTGLLYLQKPTSATEPAATRRK